MNALGSTTFSITQNGILNAAADIGTTFSSPGCVSIGISIQGTNGYSDSCGVDSFCSLGPTQGVNDAGSCIKALPPGNYTLTLWNQMNSSGTNAYARMGWYVIAQ